MKRQAEIGCGFVFFLWMGLELCHVRGALGIAIAVWVLGQLLNPTE